MKLKSKLKIILIISLATVLLVSIAFALATWRVNEARQKQEISQKIIKNFFDLNTVVYDYLLYHEDRPQIQWQQKNEAMTGFLASLKSTDPEEKALLEKIRQDHQSMKVIFSQLTEAHEKKSAAGPNQKNLLGDLEERLTLQLMTKSREIALNAAKLEEKSRVMETRTEEIYDGFIYIALLILALTMAANSYLMVQGVVKPIVKLHHGTEIIGAGNLDFKVATAAADEIGQLSRAFDQMTENLKAMTGRLELEKVKAQNYFDGAAVMQVVLDQEQKTLQVNQAGYELLGYKPQEILGRKWADIFIPEHLQAEVDEVWHKIMRGDLELVEYYENPIITKSGQEKLIGWHNTILTGEGGAFVAVLASGIDITEQKAAQDALQASERECRLLATQLLAAEEKERNRIAQELHDGVGQMLSATKYRLEIHLEQKMELPLAERRESLKPAISLLQESTEEIRRICMALRPSTLDDLGILATVNWFCREFQKIYPQILIVQETAVQEEEIPPAVKTAIFRTFQEAFNNAAKHSRASRVGITLRKTGEMLELLVEDDGQGFDLEAHRSQENHRRGIGLGSMKERVELSGGIFTLESAPGQGTFVRAAWTLEVGEEECAVRG